MLYFLIHFIGNIFIKKILKIKNKQIILKDKLLVISNMN